MTARKGNDLSTAAREYAIAALSESLDDFARGGNTASQIAVLREAFMAGAAWQSAESVQLLGGVVRSRDLGTLAQNIDPDACGNCGKKHPGSERGCREQDRMAGDGRMRSG